MLRGGWNFTIECCGAYHTRRVESEGKQVLLIAALGLTWNVYVLNVVDNNTRPLQQCAVLSVVLYCPAWKELSCFVHNSGILLSDCIVGSLVALMSVNLTACDMPVVMLCFAGISSASLVSQMQPCLMLCRNN